MKRVRVVLFWLHLVAGTVGGVFIAVMATTGILLAFESELAGLADGTSALATPGPPLPIDELVARATASGAKMNAVTWKPDAALFVSFGGGDGRYVDPATGEVRRPKGDGVRHALDFVEGVHRWLGAGEGRARDAGKIVTGTVALAFVFLGLSGLWLWLPRKWSWKSVRAVAVVRRGLSGKARDFNWHNAIGFWALPVLIVIASSGTVIGFKWANDLVYRAFGEKPPTAAPKAPPPKDPLPLDELFTRVRGVAPTARQITMRKDFTFVVKDDTGPTFGARTITLNPATGALVKVEGWAEATPGRKARIWLRFLHTGQALGIPGQIVAVLACGSALLLVWTGLALALRRLHGWRSRSRAAPTAVALSG